MSQTKINIIVPPCGGLYHYWFGVIFAIQLFIPIEVLKKINWISTSGSGYSVSTLCVDKCVLRVYLIWIERQQKQYGKYKTGMFKIFDFVYNHCSNLLNDRDIKNFIGSHTIITYNKATKKHVYWNSDDIDIETYVQVLKATSKIPYITCDNNVMINNEEHIDGAFFENKDSLTSLYENTINLGKILQYDSLNVPKNFAKIYGIASTNRFDYFMFGFKDCIQKVIKTNLITNKPLLTPVALNLFVKRFKETYKDKCKTVETCCISKYTKAKLIFVSLILYIITAKRKYISVILKQNWFNFYNIVYSIYRRKIIKWL